MATLFKVWDFPNLPVSKQVFHVPGAVFDGGFTSGGARISSPEPGGRSMLELQIALSVNERDTPLVSWLMSKINGEIFRVKLAKTPQVIAGDTIGLTSGDSGISWAAEGFYTESNWDNSEFWDNDTALYATASSLAGSTTINLDVLPLGEIFKYGHVFSIANSAYIVDDVEYTNNIASISVKPPLRKSVLLGDIVSVSPYFIGSIANGSEIRAMYEASNNGHISLNRIIFHEVVV